MMNLGDVFRVILSGGTAGQFLRLSGGTDNPAFKDLTLRDITDLSTNAANFILSGSNSSFTAFRWSTSYCVLKRNRQSILAHGDANSTAGDSGVMLKLVDAAGDSEF